MESIQWHSHQWSLPGNQNSTREPAYRQEPKTTLMRISQGFRAWDRSHTSRTDFLPRRARTCASRSSFVWASTSVWWGDLSIEASSRTLIFATASPWLLRNKPLGRGSEGGCVQGATAAWAKERPSLKLNKETSWLPEERETVTLRSRLDNKDRAAENRPPATLGRRS